MAVMRTLRRRVHRAVLGMTRPDLARAIAITDDVTLVGARQRTMLWDALGRALAVGPGDVAEFGTHRGGTAGMIAARIRDEPARHLHLFDRWGDLPETTPEDGNMAEAYKRENIPDKLALLRETDLLADVRTILHGRVALPLGRAHYYQGWLADTLPSCAAGPFVFAHVDCDYYEAVKLVLSWLDGRMVPGGTILLDDYGWWDGCRRAVHEVLPATRWHLEVLRTKQALLYVPG